MTPFPRHRRYTGPLVDRDEAVRIAWQFVLDHDLPVSRLLKVHHCRPIIYGRDDDKFFGTWEVTFESTVPPDPPNTATSPRPDHPFLILVQDQTGETDMFTFL